jgi:RecJ-like exonuclease
VETSNLRIFDECSSCGGTGNGTQWHDCQQCKGKGKTLTPLGEEVRDLVEAEFALSALLVFRASPKSEAVKG